MRTSRLILTSFDSLDPVTSKPAENCRCLCQRLVERLLFTSGAESCTTFDWSVTVNESCNIIIQSSLVSPYGLFVPLLVSTKNINWRIHCKSGQPCQSMAKPVWLLEIIFAKTLNSSHCLRHYSFIDCFVQSHSWISLADASIVLLVARLLVCLLVVLVGMQARVMSFELHNKNDSANPLLNGRSGTEITCCPCLSEWQCNSMQGMAWVLAWKAMRGFRAS